MGKFDGVLFFSDYDDTLYNSRRTVSPENHAAIRYFMEEGGRFSVATGRAHRTFTPQIEKEGLALNAPVVLSNGAAIYDYAAGRYLVRTHLCPETPPRMARLCRDFPDLAFEAYHGEDIYVHNPNVVTMKHLERVNVPYTLCPIGEMPAPWNKVIMEQDESYLRQIQSYILARWGKDYEAKVKEGIPAAKPEMYSNPFGSDYEVEMRGVELPQPPAPAAEEKKDEGKKK